MASMEVISLVFSEDIVFGYHSVAPCPSLTLPPYRSASGIGYASKKQSKMVENLASYPLHSRYSELL